VPVAIAPDGSIDVNSVRTSTDVELRAWIYARLLGQDLVVPGGTTVDDDRQLAVSIVHDRLELEHQRRVKAVVLSLLEQVVREERAEWTDDAKALLFRLVEVLLRQSVDQPMAARRLIEFINNANSELTTRRALQALAGLEFQLPEAFWLRQYRGAAFAPAVLEGLGKHSVRAAFKFLAGIEWTPTVDAALSTLLPTWAERHGRTELETAFLTTEHCFDERRRCLLRKQLALPCATSIRLFDDLERTYEPLATISYEVPA
jgi:hypothetical protein